MTGLLGTGALVRLALRRDRVMLPVWIAIFVVTAASSAKATIGVYPTVTSRVGFAELVDKTPAMIALYGRIYNGTSLGEASLIKMGGLGAALVGVLTMLTVARHTRAEEESGRLELLGATVVGRYAALAAALLVAIGASLVLGLLTALALISVGLPGSGSLAFGLAWAAVGIVFASIAGLAAQLARSSRTASGLTATALGVAYLLRAAGDTAADDGPRWLSWLSPIGWGQQVRPYAGGRWWVLPIMAGFSLLATTGAFALSGRRDMGAGLIGDRPGRATAANSLRGPFTLAWRVHRGALLAWTVAFGLLGLAFGSIASNVGNLIDSPQAHELITKLGGEKGVTDAFIATVLSIVGVIASVYGIQAALRLRTEETALRVEPLLAAPVGRIRLALSHVAISLGGTAVLLVAVGLGAGLMRDVHTHDAHAVWSVLGGALVQLPAVWVLTGIVVAVFGIVPRLTALCWVALVAFLLLGQLGPLLRLRQWVMDLSPFTHVPKLPGVALTVTPLVWLVIVTAVLIASGLAGFRRRDVG